MAWHPRPTVRSFPLNSCLGDVAAMDGKVAAARHAASFGLVIDTAYCQR